MWRRFWTCTESMRNLSKTHLTITPALKARLTKPVTSSSIKTKWLLMQNLLLNHQSYLPGLYFSDFLTYWLLKVAISFIWKFMFRYCDSLLRGSNSKVSEDTELDVLLNEVVSSVFINTSLQLYVKGYERIFILNKIRCKFAYRRVEIR